MVAGRLATDSLAGRFKSLLGSYGIVVDFDSEVLSPEERTKEAEEAVQVATENQSIDEDYASQPSQSRRDSVRSRREVELWRTGEQLDGVSEASRHNRHSRSSSQVSDPTGVKRRSSSARRRLLEQLPIRGRVNTRSVSDNLHTHYRTRSASVTSQESLRFIKRVGSQGNAHSRRTSQSSIDRDAAVQKFLEDYEYHPSETQLLADADTFENYGRLRLARQLLRHWQNKARTVMQQRGVQLTQAREILDTGLKKEIFRLWNDSYRERRLKQDLNRFWAAQEAQAQAKWDMHLMEKAFLHWATTAQEQVQRTAVARRHVLRNKYFNAWKEITAVNELKVQRFRCGRFFNRWRRQMHAVLDNDDTAMAMYEQNLAHRVFSKWLWSYRHNIAGYWAEDKIRRRFFDRWRDIVRQIRQREAMMVEIHHHDEQRKLLRLWRDKLGTARQDETTAESFHQRKVLSYALQAFNTQTKLFPSYRQIADRVDARLARSTLTVWNLRARQSRQASQIDRLRLMRNALTQWDDQLRSSWLQHRVDDRVMIEALYKLSIASKASMHARVRDYKLLNNCLSLWHANVQQHEDALKQALSQFQYAQRYIKLRYAWNRLRSRFLFHQEDEQIAVAHDYSKKVPNLFQTWRSKAHAVQHMNEQADAARYYFVITKAIKLWRNATKETQRLRRREAYGTVRRLCKMNLGRSALAAWRAKTATIQEMEQIATERAEDKVLAGLTATLHTWRDRSASIRQISQQAGNMRHKHLATLCTAKLRAQLQVAQGLDAHTQTFKAELAAVSAQKAFVKLGWRLFELQRLNQNALALRDKHKQSHIRSMLRYWAERAAMARLRHAGAVGEDRADDGNDFTIDGGGDDGQGLGDQTHVPSDVSMLRAEEWTALDESALDFSKFKLNLDLIPEASTEDLEGIITSTPVPGYLRTPSRRSTARSRARERLLALTSGNIAPATPGTSAAHNGGFPGRAATAPPAAVERDMLGARASSITPFEQRLRAQGYNAARSRGNANTGIGRGEAGPSSFMRGRGSGFAGFEDISEHDSIKSSPEK